MCDILNGRLLEENVLRLLLPLVLPLPLPLLLVGAVKVWLLRVERNDESGGDEEMIDFDVDLVTYCDWKNGTRSESAR